MSFPKTRFTMAATYTNCNCQAKKDFSMVSHGPCNYFVHSLLYPPFTNFMLLLHSNFPSLFSLIFRKCDLFFSVSSPGCTAPHIHRFSEEPKFSVKHCLHVLAWILEVEELSGLLQSFVGVLSDSEGYLYAFAVFFMEFCRCQFFHTSIFVMSILMTFWWRMPPWAFLWAML
jgi:hypothetical protein